MIEQSINNLKEYIEKDEIYQTWDNAALENTSDFDQFCINHCCDIKKVLDEISNLTKECDELRQENKRLNGAIDTYNILLKSNVEINKQLKEKIQKVIDFVLDYKRWLQDSDLVDRKKVDHINDYILEILGDNNE